MEDNNLIISVIIAVAVFLLLGMFGFNGMMNGGMMGNWSYGFGGMWIFGFLFMTLILVALVLFILWLIKQIQTPERNRK
ncbi:hypothetical protein GW923_04455 [Candidatus Pacearchaeota archaeon]|nr:hypothetical protein [Candidatus Pacearchaeota archaeon]